MNHQISAGTRATLVGSEPIFAVSDVRETIRFYREVLGFESEWLWGDPPTFGGVRWRDVHIMFCLQPDMKGKTEGLQHWFRVDDVQALYERHKLSHAPIVDDIENKPWGMREYTVRDPNGYHLRFAGPATYERPATGTDTLPEHIRIELGRPTLDEYRAINESVGWSGEEGPLKQALERSLFWVRAVDNRDGRVVGITRAVGDGKAYTIWDVMVVTEMQGQKIGSALMRCALNELRRIGPKGAFVGLFTGRPDFYERLGFSKGYGMHLAL